MRRFFVDKPLKSEIVISDLDAHHIVNVLRLTSGERILVVGSCGKTGVFEILTITSRDVIVRLLEFVQEKNEPPITVTLVQGLAKGDKMDYVVQKAVELGVTIITPLLAKNCVVKYDAAKQRNRVERWQKIASEAAKQCGRTIMPQVTDIKTWKELFNQIAPDSHVFLFYEGNNLKGIKQTLTTSGSLQGKDIVIIIGPEGGFAEEEVQLCRENGAQVVSLGPRILRTETAALASIAVVMYECGDLGG